MIVPDWIGWCFMHGKELVYAVTFLVAGLVSLALYWFIKERR